MSRLDPFARNSVLIRSMTDKVATMKIVSFMRTHLLKFWMTMATNTTNCSKMLAVLLHVVVLVVIPTCRYPSGPSVALVESFQGTSFKTTTLFVVRSSSTTTKLWATSAPPVYGILGRFRKKEKDLKQAKQIEVGDSIPNDIDVEAAIRSTDDDTNAAAVVETKPVSMIDVIGATGKSIIVGMSSH